MKSSSQRKAPSPDKPSRRETVFTPRTLDPETRTVEVVAATETPVLMASFFGPVREILKCDAASVETTRLDGLPVLDSHNRSSILSTLGRATKWRLADGQLLVTFKFADTDRGREAFDLVKDGMINKVSVGYRIVEFEETEARRGDVLRTVTKWTPYEVSLVNVPADHNATIRGASTMDRDEIQDTDTDDRSSDRGDVGSQRSAGFSRELDYLRRSAAASGISEADFEVNIKDVRTITGAREATLAMLADRSRQIKTVPFRGDPEFSSHHRGDGINNQVIDAIAVRLGAPASDSENPLRHRSLTEIGRAYFENSGANVRSLSDLEISNVMLGQGGSWIGGSRSMHTTSDFPMLLQDAATRALLARYGVETSPLKIFSQRRDPRDFRTTTMIRPGEAPLLEEVLEDAEIKAGTLDTAYEQFKIKTYAKRFGLSRQAIVNDDLNAFADFVQAMAEAAVQTEGNLFYALLSQNSLGGAKTTDGNNFFHANHSNLATPGTAITVDDIGKARAAMRRQKNVNGTGYAGTVPKYLLVGPDKEIEAQKVVANINAASVDEVNPFSGKLEVVVENRIAGLDWYLFGDRPAFMHGYLSGYEGPQITTRDGWEILGTEFRCVLDFGCGPLDYKVAYRNPGA